jgi:hypothetical protein
MVVYMKFCIGVFCLILPLSAFACPNLEGDLICTQDLPYADSDYNIEQQYVINGVNYFDVDTRNEGAFPTKRTWKCDGKAYGISTAFCPSDSKLSVHESLPKSEDDLLFTKEGDVITLNKVSVSWPSGRTIEYKMNCTLYP